MRDVIPFEAAASIDAHNATEAYDRGTLRRRARAAWRAAGLDPITPHECRHTFGSMLAAAGVDVNDRQRQMATPPAR